MQVNCTLGSAAVADPFYNYVGFFGRIVPGDVYGRDLHFWQTLRFVADLAMKMHMDVLWIVALAGVGANSIFYGAGAIVDTVNYLVILEGFERTEKRYPVCGFQAEFEIFEADGVAVFLDEIKHKHPHCRRLYFPCFKLFC